MPRAFALKPAPRLLGLLEAKSIARAMAAFTRELACCGFIAVSVHAEVLLAAAAMLAFALAALGKISWCAANFT